MNVWTKNKNNTGRFALHTSINRIMTANQANGSKNSGFYDLPAWAMEALVSQGWRILSDEWIVHVEYVQRGCETDAQTPGI